jgi:hypothetical protein
MARATSAASPGPGSGTRTCPRPSSVMSKIFGLTSEQRPWPWQRLASMDSGTCGPLSYHVRLHAFLHEHVDEATSSRAALSAWGSGRAVCGAGDLTRPAHRTSVIRSGRGGPPGRRRFPWMYTGTPPSAAVREPDLSPVARILPRAARFSTCLAVDGHRGPSRTPRVATSLGRSLPGPDAGHPLQGAGQSRKKELDVPVACPIGRSTPGTYGHSRTTRHVDSPA